MSGRSGTPTPAPMPDWGVRRDFYTFAPETLAQELPEFEILSEVGKGSMGIVYEARVRATGQHIALKVLPPSLTLTERALARFYREGRLMAKVHHPDIVGFYDQGTRGRLHWFAMEFVRGRTLEQRLQVGPLPVRQACEIAARVARALQFAHDRGVVHRDIKPGNVMLRSGDGGGGGELGIAITDFGLARETGTGSMTESGAIVGTPMFMAPEMVLGGTAQAGSLADVYSLGATLYMLVTGRPPHDGPTGQAVLKAVLEEEPQPATSLRRDLPRPVAAILHKAMEREPERRYGSALEFAEDLERHLRGERVLARLPGPGGRLWRLARRRPLVAGLGAAVLLLALGGAWLLREQHRTELLQRLAEAQRYLALAATTRDDGDRARSVAERRDLLLSAVATATAVIEADPGDARAYIVRAKAHQRLRQFEDAVHDLDAAETHGGGIAEVLNLRIDALGALGDHTSTQRLQEDLTHLLRIAPDLRTRALVAGHLVDLADQASGAERREALASAAEVLGDAPGDDARIAVLRARMLEVGGDIERALAAMRQLRSQFEGDLLVHLEAAAMFDRQGLQAEGAREHEVARLLDPAQTDQPKPPAVDIDGLGKFLGDVDRLMQALDPADTPPKGNQQPDRKD